MSKERLSRLQKWILKTLYESESNIIPVKRIYEGYFGLIHDRYGHYNDPEKTKQARKVSVIVSRSIRRLCERGLIESIFVDYHDEERDPSFGRSAVKIIEKGKILIVNIVLNDTGVNNKKEDEMKRIGPSDIKENSKEN